MKIMFEFTQFSQKKCVQQNIRYSDKYIRNLPGLSKSREIFFLKFALNSRFDANAPYTATALGITTKLHRRPYKEWTTRNKNIACIYAGKYSKISDPVV